MSTMKIAVSGSNEMFQSVERTYFNYVFESTNSAKRIRKRQELTREVYDWLLTREAGSSLSPIISDTIIKNLKQSSGRWNPQLSADAFRYMEEYSWRLYDDPWKPELRHIKVYTGIMQVHIKPYIPNLESILSLLGYKETLKGYELQSDVQNNKDGLSNAAVHCFLAHIECTIMADILEKVKIYRLNAYHVYECRMSFKGSLPECVKWIQKKNKKDIIVESTDSKNIYGNGEIAIKHEVFKDKSKITGVGARPKDVKEYISKPHKAVSNGRTSNHEAIASQSGSGHGSKNTFEKQCSILGDISNSELYGHDIKGDNGYYHDYRAGTFEDHLQESLSFLGGSDKSSQKSRSPINIEGWELIDHNATRQPMRIHHSEPIPIDKTPSDAVFQKLLFKKNKAAESNSSRLSDIHVDNIHGSKSSSYGIAYPPLSLQSAVTTDGPASIQKQDDVMSTVDKYKNKSLSVVRERGERSKMLDTSTRKKGSTSPQPDQGCSQHVPKLESPADIYETVHQGSNRASIYDNVPYTEDAVRRYLQDPYITSTDKIESEDIYCGTGRHDAHQSLPNISSDSTTKNKMLSKVNKSSHMTDLGKEGTDFQSLTGTNQPAQSSLTSLTRQSLQMQVCRHCTVFIPVGSNVCDLCGKTQVDDGVHPLETGGAECLACTLVNPPNTLWCKACKTSLKGTSTYV